VSGCFCFSRAERSSAAVATLAAGSAGSVCPAERGCGRVCQFKRPLLPLVVHKPAAAGGALSSRRAEIQPVHAAQQHDGHRRHLRARGAAALLGGRVGPQHPVLPGTPDDGPGSSAQASVERAIRLERQPILDAAPRGAPLGRGGPPRVPHGGGPRGRLHGPHQDLPGASGEAQGASRRLGGIQLSQSHRPLHHR